MNEDTMGGAGPAGDERVMARALEAGTQVCVWNHFFEGWTGGFSVAGVEDGGYRLARVSDGHVFDDVFPHDAVIPERRKAQDPGFVDTEHDRRREVQTSDPADDRRRREPFLR